MTPRWVDADLDRVFGPDPDRDRNTPPPPPPVDDLPDIGDYQETTT